MHAFAFHQPASVSEAVSLLGDAIDVRPLAGGMTLLPTIKQRLSLPTALVDLSGIDGLTGIVEGQGGIFVGAMTRHVDVERSSLVKSAIPALAKLAGGIGDPAVRNRGTIGGSLANSDPAADYPAAALGLGATIVTNQREIAADAFFTGLFETALTPGEIITGVRFPIPTAAAYEKFRSPASRYAIVGVFVAQFSTGTRVAVTGAGPFVFRIPDLEVALSKDFSPAAVEGVRVGDTGLTSDIHAEAAYRAHLVGVMAKRAVAAALKGV